MGKLFKNPIFWLIIAGLLMFGAVKGWSILHSSPGGEDTDDQDENENGRPKFPREPVARLQLKWDAEGKANWPAAEVLATLSEIAYLPPQEADVAYRKLGFESVIPILDGSQVGFIVAHKSVTVIVFRGTDDRGDWLVNLDQFSTKVAEGRAHQGFHNSYQRLKPQVVQALSKNKPKNLWITGHSLGGALAVCCALDIERSDEDSVRGLITFGQPMVADADLAAYWDQKLIGRYAHYVNDNDVVARVPPGYKHFGSLVWFQVDGGIRRSKPKRKMVFNAAPGEPSTNNGMEVKPLSQSEFDALKTGFKRSEPVKGPDGGVLVQGNTPYVEDHAMQLYLKKIRATLAPKIEHSDGWGTP